MAGISKTKTAGHGLLAKWVMWSLYNSTRVWRHWARASEGREREREFRSERHCTVRNTTLSSDTPVAKWRQEWRALGGKMGVRKARWPVGQRVGVHPLRLRLGDNRIPSASGSAANKKQFLGYCRIRHESGRVTDGEGVMVILSICHRWRHV